MHERFETNQVSCFSLVDFHLPIHASKLLQREMSINPDVIYFDCFDALDPTESSKDPEPKV